MKDHPYGIDSIEACMKPDELEAYQKEQKENRRFWYKASSIITSYVLNAVLLKLIVSPWLFSTSIHARDPNGTPVVVGVLWLLSPITFVLELLGLAIVLLVKGFWYLGDFLS